MTPAAQIAADVLFSRITKDQADVILSQPCDDPWGHVRLYAGSERVWRLSAAQIAEETRNKCGWCGRPWEIAVAQALLTPDCPDLPDGVDGHPIAGRRA